MAKIVLVHGAFNELWGPNELKSRWLPAVRDGLWHHGLEIDDDDVQVCFYGDLFRRAPGTAEDEQFEQSRAGIAESLHELVGDETRVLGAHSLGTVLSYMALANHPQWNVHTFVTLGSPLASPMLGDMLDPPLVDGKGQWPGAVQRWVNVRAIGDKAAEVSL